MMDSHAEPMRGDRWLSIPQEAEEPPFVAGIDPPWVFVLVLNNLRDLNRLIGERLPALFKCVEDKTG